MSTKSRSSTCTFPRQIINETGKVLVNDSLSYLSSSEGISSSDTRFHGTSNCTHSKVFIVHSSGQHTYYGGSSGTTRWNRSSPVAFGVELLSGDLSAPTIDLSSLHAEAFRTMRPGMESGFSGTNFILELRDMRNLFSIWNHAQSFLKNLSSGVLNYHYGWKQTIRDATEIKNRLLSFSENFDRLISGQNRSTKRHFSKVLESARASTEGPWINWGNDAVRYVYTYVQPCLYTATMQFRYSLPDMSRAALRARALADHFGLKVNASTVWNAIPLSFVGDWFVGVGDFLSQFDRDWINPSVEIQDFCYSLKYDLNCDIYCQRNVSNPANRVWTYSHSCRRKFYTRQRTLPNPYYWCSLSTDTSGWDSTRYLLAGSLLHQRL